MNIIDYIDEKSKDFRHKGDVWDCVVNGQWCIAQASDMRCKKCKKRIRVGEKYFRNFAKRGFFVSQKFHQKCAPKHD